MLNRILHIILLFSVLTSSTSWIMHQHFCSNELVNSTFFTPADSCHETMPVKDGCPMHAQEKDDCCSNESFLVKAELNFDLYFPQLKEFYFVAIPAFFAPDVLNHLQISEIDSESILVDWGPPSPSAVDLPRIQRFLC